MDLIVYHNNCPDGFTAAYIAKKKYPEATLFPRDYGLEPPYEEVTGKDVLVVDFSWRTREQNDKLAQLAKSFQILDHHKTAQAVLYDAPYAIFDMNRSGAGLAWDYLFGKDSPEQINATESVKEYRPWWVRYVEDHDLWKHELPNSEAVAQYVTSFDYTIESWSELTRGTALMAADAGKVLLMRRQKDIKELAQQRQLGEFKLRISDFEGVPPFYIRRTCAIVNSPYLFASDLGHELTKYAEVGASWFLRHDGVIQFSLRSVGDIDVSEIAKNFNGGGHKNAAGFQLPFEKGIALLTEFLG